MQSLDFILAAMITKVPKRKTLLDSQFPRFPPPFPSRSRRGIHCSLDVTLLLSTIHLTSHFHTLYASDRLNKLKIRLLFFSFDCRFVDFTLYLQKVLSPEFLH